MCHGSGPRKRRKQKKKKRKEKKRNILLKYPKKGNNYLNFFLKNYSQKKNIQRKKNSPYAC